MRKYNLTFFQRIELPFIWLIWYNTDESKRKSWHLVKKGMEYHKCNFIIPGIELDIKVLRCDHEGCNMVLPVNDILK